MKKIGQGEQEKKHFKEFVSLILLFFVFTVYLFISPFNAYALDVPPLKGYVNDYAGMMSPSVRARLEKELKAFEESDSTQVVILTIPSLKGEVLEEYSIKVAEKWKIGHKGKDNGVILLVAKDERRLRIEVGRGLEGRLTDLTAGRIIDMAIKPRFKRGDFDGGFIAGVHAIIDATRGEFTADTKAPQVKKKEASPIWTFIFFAGVILVFLGRFSKIISGVLGAIGLPLLAFFIFSPPIITLILLGILGLVIGLVFPMFFGGWGRGGGTSSGWGSWGTGGGGGFDSGGFSGGGGDFGGGGASGDW
ncbi:MAG TPA: TPM domain-containing protein [Syntrophorhabdaceae bacterium]|nr:TPM domain-containing protein [Syntrophorhabdaceae bacterium]